MRCHWVAVIGCICLRALSKAGRLGKGILGIGQSSIQLLFQLNIIFIFKFNLYFSKASFSSVQLLTPKIILSNVWSPSSSFPILKTLAFFRPTNLASEPTILPNRLYCLFSLPFALLLTNRSSPYWPCLMYLLLSTWSTTKSSLSVLRPRVESHLSLFFGSNLTSLTVLK